MTKIKTIITAVAAIFVIILTVGLCLQFFGNDQVKPSNWINNNKKSDLVKLESGQVIKGVKFDTSKEPDLSCFEPSYSNGSYLSLFDFFEDGHLTEPEDNALIAVYDFGLAGKLLGLNLGGKALVYLGADSDEIEDMIIYADSDIGLGGLFGEELGTYSIKKGWNKSLLNKDGELLFTERVKVFNTYYSSSWNGVYMGALEVDGFCKHKVIEQGACKECDKCFHEYLNLNDKCRACGEVMQVSYLMSDLSNLKVQWNQSEQEVFKEIIITFYSNELNREFDVKYPDFKVENFSSDKVGSYVDFDIVYGEVRTTVTVLVQCDDPNQKNPLESEYHKTLGFGETCSSCKFTNYLSIKDIKGFPEEIVYDEYIESTITDLLDKIEIVYVDNFGNEYIESNQTHEYVSGYTVGEQTLTVECDFSFLENGHSSFTKTFSIIEEVTNNE